MGLFGNSAEQIVARGAGYAMKGQLDRAIADFGTAIRLDPQRADYFSVRGSAHWQKGDLDSAIVDFDAAIRLNPTCAAFYVSRGSAHAMKEQHDHAIADFNAAIMLDPKIAIAFFGRGTSYRKTGQYERAIVDLDEAISREPEDAYFYAGRADAYYDKGDYDRAIADYDEALKRDPHFQWAIDLRATALALKNDPARLENDNADDPWFQQHVTLITEGDLETYCPEFIDLIKRAAKEALQPELIALSQEIHGTPSSRAAELITVDDVEYYGYSLIDLSKRAAKETIAPELNALTQEISALKRKIGLPAAIRANTAPPARLLTEQDEQDYGPELIDLLKRAGNEIAAPELNALKHEIACLKQTIGTPSTSLKSSTEITQTERADLLAKVQFDALTAPQKVAVGAASLGTAVVVGAGIGVMQAALAPVIAAVALPIGAPLLGLFYGKMALDAYRKHRRKKDGLSHDRGDAQ